MIKKKNQFYRLLYILPAILFAWALIDQKEDLDQISSVGVSYGVVIIIPLMIFTYQSFRNSVTGWVLVMLLYIFYLTDTSIQFIDTYNLIGIKSTWLTILQHLAFTLVLLAIGYVYWRVRPKYPLI